MAVVMNMLFQTAISADQTDLLNEWTQVTESLRITTPSALSPPMSPNVMRSGRAKDSPDLRSSRDSGSAFFKSLLFPGWGQYSQGRKGSAMAYMVGEVLLITGIIIEKTYAGWLKDDYQSFAAQHAGVYGDKGHQYYVDIGNWMDTRSFNEKRIRNRQYDDIYTDSGSAWSWDSDQNRREFKATRLASDHAGQRVMLLVGGLLLNHMVSGIEASRVPKSQRKVSLESHVSDEMAVLQIGFTLP